MSKRFLSTVVATGVAAVSFVALGPAGAAGAAPLVCEPGYKSASWTSLDKSWVITTPSRSTSPRAAPAVTPRRRPTARRSARGAR